MALGEKGKQELGHLMSYSMVSPCGDCFNSGPHCQCMAWGNHWQDQQCAELRRAREVSLNHSSWTDLETICQRSEVRALVRRSRWRMKLAWCSRKKAPKEGCLGERVCQAADVDHLLLTAPGPAVVIFPTKSRGASASNLKASASLCSSVF